MHMLASVLGALDALPWTWGVIFGALLGLIWGSFAATLVLRWPAGRSLGGRSACDGCGRSLGVRDLVPLLSARWRRGRCPDCGAAIDPFHDRVELGAAMIGAAALAIMPGLAGWSWALFGWLLLPLALLDARHYWLPDRLTLPLAVIGLVAGGALLDLGIWDRWMGAVAGGLSLLLVAWGYRRLRGSEGMGGGDPKLFAAIGAWTGWQALPFILLIASLCGLGWALASQQKGDTPLVMRRIPFGSFLCVAAWAGLPLWPLVAGL
ncbi:prepilin peptidase [Sphingopyxis sp. MWB1]|uniref:prepilin peptidase n=1 Tax=Sphingopyxis sp. MWB1 TaxID=1537715 RepID=UPI001F26D008|nr:A24 family peptidase [Sphingopyxis sp. MWB1]